MNNLIVQEAIHTGRRNTSTEWYKDLILLYTDGTWEKIFRSSLCNNIKCINVLQLKGMTRDQVVARLEKLYYDGKLDGRFLD